MKNSARQDYRVYHPDKRTWLLLLAKAGGIVFAFSYFFYRSIWASLPLLWLGALYIRQEKLRLCELRKEELTGQFKECILAVSTSLQSGYAIENAFLESRNDMRSLYGEQAYIYRELECFRRGMVINISIEEQLADFAERSGCEEILQFSGIFSIAKRSGGNMTEIIRMSAELIGRKIEAQKEIQLILAGKRMEQTIMRIMPFGILCYLGMSYPGFFDTLYHNFQGVVVMSFCLVTYLFAYYLGERTLDGIQREMAGKTKKEGDKYNMKEPSGEFQGIKKLMYRLYLFGKEKELRLFSSSEVSRNLHLLYPEGSRERIRETYYVDKLTLCFLLWVAGSFLALLFFVKEGGMSGSGRYGFWAILMMPFLAAGLFFLRDKDLEDELNNRKKRLKLQYPDLVHKLVLYLGAGMSVRGSFQKLAEHYDMAVYACRELKSGMTEGVVYDRFGKRTGVREYIHLATLLTQNLKKGNTTLLSRLDEEAYKASADRVRNARRLGEEAGTKLLIPMVMFLGIVMIMIMIPAFQGLGIG